MSYNRSYRQQVAQPGRYNSPGQFVSSGEMNMNQGTPTRTTRSSAASATTNFSNLYPAGTNPPPPPPPPQSATAAPAQQYQQPQPPQQKPQQQQVEVSYSEEVEPKSELMDTSVESDATGNAARPRPHWMKPKGFGGVAKKISNKERRRRQNEHLRRLLTPKNALMVLNELMPGEQLTQNFTVEAAPTNTQFFRQDANHKFCAGLAVDGNIYKGFGENKMIARNSAAEQAIRDMVIKRMVTFSKLLTEQPAAGESMDQNCGEENGSTNADENETEPLPMIQLASYALHKLFSEWQYEGYQVPLLPKNSTSSTSDKPEDVLSSPVAPRPQKSAKKPKGAKELPADAATLHPCMLLTHMRQGLVYHELGTEGDKPQNMMFTMGVTVDGTTYIGKAANKKEARKQAARQACQALFNVTFVDAAAAAH